MCQILRIRNKNVGDMTKFSELPEQPSYRAVTQHFLEKSFKKLLMKTQRRKNRKTQKIVFFSECLLRLGFLRVFVLFCVCGFLYGPFKDGLLFSCAYEV